MRLDSGRPRFVHPLAQAAVWDGAEPGARRAAHRAVAAAWNAAGDHERAAWHLADAADGPDAAASLALADVARAARARGAPYEAAQAWDRAAEIEPDPGERLRLGFEEACDLAQAGRAADARPRRPDARRSALRVVAGGPRAAARGRADLAGRLEEAAARFERASAEIRASDARPRLALLCGAAFAQAMAR